VDERRSWVEVDNALLSVRQQCEILGVGRSSIYYAPRPKRFSDGQLNLLRLVDEIYTKHPFFGTRQMSDYITLHKYPCGRHETRWAYEQLGLQSVAQALIQVSPTQSIRSILICLMMLRLYDLAKCSARI